MTSRKKVLLWRVGYAVCTLAYMAWVVHLSFNNFDMVHSHYRQAGLRLQPAHIEATALKGLVAQCRKENKGVELLPGVEDPCQSFPAAVVEARQKRVEERALAARSLAWRKMVVFYLSFGTIFLILPPVGLRLLISFSMMILRNLKLIE